MPTVTPQAHAEAALRLAAKDIDHAEDAMVALQRARMDLLAAVPDLYQGDDPQAVVAAINAAYGVVCPDVLRGLVFGPLRLVTA